MLEETDSQPCAFRRALYQPGNVCDDETLMSLHADHTEIGHQGGERIVRHLGAGSRHGTNKGRLTGIGHTQKTDIRQYLQLQPQVAKFTLGAFCSLTRGAVDRGLEASVTQPVKTGLGHLQALPGTSQIPQHFVGIHIHNRSAYRHRQHQVVALDASAVAA